jgi:hypothetical protein
MCFTAVTARAGIWEKISVNNLGITAGLGGAFPARSAAFSDNAATGFYRFVCAEYRINSRLVGGAQYGGANFDLDSGGVLKDIHWGPYLLTYFDLIPRNHVMLFLKFGATKNNITVPDTEEQLVEFTPKWEMFGGLGTEFYAQGDVRARLGVDFWDMQDSRIGAFFVYGALAFDPFSL